MAVVAVTVVAAGDVAVSAATVVAVRDVDDNDTECVSHVGLRFGNGVVAVTVEAVGCGCSGLTVDCVVGSVCVVARGSMTMRRHPTGGRL